MTERPSRAENLDQLDVEVREPTIVVSVRLDADTARVLTAVARKGKRRMSEVLRDAAKAYVATAETEPAGQYYSLSFRDSAGSPVDVGSGGRNATRVRARADEYKQGEVFMTSTGSA